MGKKATALALAALLMLGLSGCGTDNGTRSTYENRNTYGTRDDYLDGFGRNRGLGDSPDTAARDTEDAFSGDRRRFQEMLENGRVHDTDGFLLDGENRHD